MRSLIHAAFSLVNITVQLDGHLPPQKKLCGVKTNLVEDQVDLTWVSFLAQVIPLLANV